MKKFLKSKENLFFFFKCFFKLVRFTNHTLIINTVISKTEPHCLLVETIEKVCLDFVSISVTDNNNKQKKRRLTTPFAGLSSHFFPRKWLNNTLFHMDVEPKTTTPTPIDMEKTMREHLLCATTLVRYLNCSIENKRFLFHVFTMKNYGMLFDVGFCLYVSLLLSFLFIRSVFIVIV